LTGALESGFTAALTAGIGYGLSETDTFGQAVNMPKTLSGAGLAGTNSGLNPLGQFAMGAGAYGANVVSANVFNQPEHFSWAGMAASAVAQGVTAYTGLPSAADESKGITTGAIAADFAGGVLSSGIDREVSLALGDDHVQSWEAIGEGAAGRALGNAVGNMVSDAIGSPWDSPATIAARRQASNANGQSTSGNGTLGWHLATRDAQVPAGLTQASGNSSDANPANNGTFLLGTYTYADVNGDNATAYVYDNRTLKGAELTDAQQAMLTQSFPDHQGSPGDWRVNLTEDGGDGAMSVPAKAKPGDMAGLLNSVNVNESGTYVSGQIAYTLPPMPKEPVNQPVPEAEVNAFINHQAFELVTLPFHAAWGVVKEAGNLVAQAAQAKAAADQIIDATMHRGMAYAFGDAASRHQADLTLAAAIETAKQPFDKPFKLDIIEEAGVQASGLMGGVELAVRAPEIAMGLRSLAVRGMDWITASRAPEAAQAVEGGSALAGDMATADATAQDAVSGSSGASAGDDVSATAGDTARDAIRQIVLGDINDAGQFARFDTAFDIYSNNGFSDERLISHLKGIDYTQPVELTPLNPGENYVQHVLNDRVGNYFAEVGTPAETLGINPEGRVARIFSPSESTIALRSTAAKIVDTWTSPGQSFEAAGGGRQLFVANKGVMTEVLGPEGIGDAAAVSPQRTVLSTAGVSEQAQLAASMVPGLTEAQARVLLEGAFNPNKPVEVVLGGSRVRSYFGEGTFRPDSDLDIGFNAKMKNNQVDRILDSFDAEGPLQSERGIRIFSGNNPPSGLIESPQEFFQRSGVRGPFPPERAGEPFGPSGFISFHPDGTVTIVPPGGGL
jgi:hypothetical protein